MAAPSSQALKHQPCRYQAAHDLPTAKVSAVKMKGERVCCRDHRGCPESLQEIHHTPPPSPAHLAIIHVTPPQRWCAAAPPSQTTSRHPQTRTCRGTEDPPAQPSPPCFHGKPPTKARRSVLGATGLSNAKAIKLMQNGACAVGAVGG